MEITDVKIRKVFNGQPLRAVMSITLDNCVAVHDVKIVYAGDKYFVVMPSKKTRDGEYKDIVHPISSEFRTKLEDVLIKEYLSVIEVHTQMHN